MPVELLVSASATTVLWSFPRPHYPTEEMEEESVMEGDAELTLSKVEEEMTVGIHIAQ